MIVKKVHKGDREIYLHVGFEGDDISGYAGVVYKTVQKYSGHEEVKDKDILKTGEMIASLFLDKISKSFVNAIRSHIDDIPPSVQNIAVVINPKVVNPQFVYFFEEDVTLLRFDMGLYPEWLESPKMFDDVVEHEFVHGIDPIKKRYHLLINAYKDYLKSYGTKELWGAGGLIYSMLLVRGEGLAGLNGSPFKLSKKALVYFHNNIKGLALGYIRLNKLYSTGVLHEMGDAMARIILLYWRLVEGDEITFSFDLDGRKAELIATRESVGLGGFVNDINYLIHKCAHFEADIRFSSEEIDKLKRAMFDMDHMDFIKEYEKACLNFRIKKENMIISEESFKELKRMAREARDAHPDELMTHIA